MKRRPLADSLGEIRRAKPAQLFKELPTDAR
jgi:hypothetical protein